MGWIAKGFAGICLSVVVPARDEADSLARLVEEITDALRPVFGACGFEILVVDDGSDDQTRVVLKELARTFPELRGIGLADNVGQSVATLAGIRMARGEWIANLDADLQNDPADLVRLWVALGDGYDAALVVAGGAPGLLVETVCEPVGQLGAEWGSGSVDRGYGVFGADLQAVGGASIACVSGDASVFWSPLVA